MTGIRALRSAWLFLCAAALVCPAQQRAAQGSEPQANFGARDIFQEYNLPPLQERPSDPLRLAEQDNQVLARARTKVWNERTATATWLAAAEVYAAGLRLANSPSPSNVVQFSGKTASELNVLLAAGSTRAVRLTGSDLVVDVPIALRRPNISLDLGKARLAVVGAQTFILRVEGAQNIHIQGGQFSGRARGILVSRSQQISVSGITVQDAVAGVVVTNSRDVVIRDSSFRGLQEAPILLHGDTHHALVLGNQITGNLGNSNWHAGLVLSDRNADVAADPRNLLRNDNYGVQEQPITSRLAVPTDNLIAFNNISGNKSSGIYSDGASRNVFAQNSIEGNSKEGFCLDNGSTANVVVFNVLRANGKRWGKTDGDLQRDFVIALGRLPDGSSPAKLPGISLDNAAFNQILFNNVHDNFGGGIKMVRTSFYNTVGMNTLNENNEGRSQTFHFFGIELGAATADVKVPDLDFRPSRGNTVFGNVIRGKHYAGIFFAAGSDRNDIFDNSIFGATDWAMEAVERLQNRSFNNLSNLRCRNVSTGLDPHLVELGSGQ